MERVLIMSHCQSSYDMPRASVLGPILFNLFLNDLGKDKVVYKIWTSHKLIYWITESKFKMIPTNLNCRLNKAQEIIH